MKYTTCIWTEPLNSEGNPAGRSSMLLPTCTGHEPSLEARARAAPTLENNCSEQEKDLVKQNTQAKFSAGFGLSELHWRHKVESTWTVTICTRLEVNSWQQQRSNYSQESVASFSSHLFSWKNRATSGKLLG